MVALDCVRKAIKEPTVISILHLKVSCRPSSSFSAAKFCSSSNYECYQPKNAFRWKATIRSEAISGSQHSRIISLYQHMLKEGVLPDNFTFPLILKACTGLSRALGEQIHAHIVRLGFESNQFAATALIDTYGKCNHLADAKEVFDKMPLRDLVAWTTLISVFSQNGDVRSAFDIFSQMRVEGISVDLVTVASLLTACRSPSYLRQGESVHSFSIKVGFQGNIAIGNTLIDMYSKCWNLDNGIKVFNGMVERDVVSWNALIAGSLHNVEPRQALAIFDKMMLMDATLPNRVTLLTVAPCCGSLGDTRVARSLHAYVVKKQVSGGNLFEDVVLATAIVDMYSKCEDLELAHMVFARIKKKNVVSWSVLIAAYEQALMPGKSLHLFHQMLALEGAIKPNEVTMLSVLSACSQLGALDQAKLMHEHVTKFGLGSNIQVTSVLIDMYAKCGSLEMAREIFSKMTEKTIVSWSTMIAAEGMYGEGKRALELFEEMVQQGLQPNEVTFISLLSACSHSGLVNEGNQIFQEMDKDYGVQPSLKHYSCMIDLLGRAGRLDEAHELIKSMPLEADAGVWGSLIGACRLHGNCELGEVAEKQILSLNPSSVGHRVLLANMYGAAGRWDDVVRMRVSLKGQGLKKKAGCSFIEIGGKIHKFAVEDRTHLDADRIFKQLEALDHLLKGAGYVPNTTAVVYNIDEKLKEYMLKYHSEKLAIAFGIINTSNGDTIRITKNLRICDDCHTYSKLVSKVMGRELIIRDAYRFHHFKRGFCSCGDYW